MNRRSFDDEMATAAAIVRSQDDAARAREDQSQRDMAQARLAEAERAVIWDEFLALGRECAAKLRGSRIKPTKYIDSWVYRWGGYEHTSTRYKAWSITVGDPQKPASQSNHVLLREDGLIGWQKVEQWGRRHLRGRTVTLANFPHPTPADWAEGYKVDGFYIHEGVVVVVVTHWNAFGDKDTYLHDAREALTVATVRLLNSR